jgi:hemoglobin
MKGRMVSSLVTLIVGVLVLSGVNLSVSAQKKTAQSAADRMIAEARALDQQFLEAFNRMDLEKVMGCYWQSPELTAIFPDGKMLKGWDDVRKEFQVFLGGVERIRAEIGESSYVPAGDGVLGVGTLTVVMKLKDGPEETGTIRFTTFMRKVGGKMVYVHDHPHAVLPPPGPKPTDSLYKRLGGYDAIAAVVDDFIVRLMKDPDLGRFFIGHGAESGKRIRQQLVDQLCQATGGPCIYTGRDMKSVHAGLGITNGQWDTMVKLLVQTLDKFSVPERERNELFTALSGLKRDIVEK